MAFRSLARRFLLGAAFIGFAARAWIPAGFMPGSAADGGPIVFCPAGAGGALIAMLAARETPRHTSPASAGADMGHAAGMGSAGHIAHVGGMGHMGHAGGNGGHDDGQPGFDAHYCPLGVTFASAALAPSFDVALLDLSFSQPVVAEVRTAARSTIQAYESRAPPSI